MMEMMRRVLTLGVFMVLAAGYSSYALLRPISPLQPESNFRFARAAQAVKLNWPAYGSSAIGAPGYGVLETHGSDKPLPTASTIKVLTALLILNQKPLQLHEQGPTIIIKAADVASYDKFAALNGSVVRVSLGEKISEYQALQAMLIPSANNMAETLARWTFGSLPTFNRYASEYAIKLGLNRTTITDPSGFSPTTVSSASDLVKLGIIALSNPVISDIVSQSSAMLPVAGTVRNYNALLGQGGIVGIKTGNSDRDPGCYLFASKQQISGKSLTVVGAIMNGPSLWRVMQDSLPLLTSVASSFTRIQIVTPKTVLATYKPAWQTGVSAVPTNGLSLLVWNDSVTSVSVKIDTLPAAAAHGTLAGSLRLDNSKLVDSPTVQVELGQPINPPDPWWRLVHPL